MYTPKVWYYSVPAIQNSAPKPHAHTYDEGYVTDMHACISPAPACICLAGLNYRAPTLDYVLFER